MMLAYRKPWAFVKVPFGVDIESEPVFQRHGCDGIKLEHLQIVFDIGPFTIQVGLTDRGIGRAEADRRLALIQDAEVETDGQSVGDMTVKADTDIGGHGIEIDVAVEASD